MGATQMSTNGWIDKRCGIYMQWNNNQPLKENSVTCHNMDEPWDKWNKPPTKGQILYDSTYVENSRIHKILSNFTEIEKWLTKWRERE